MNEIKEKYCIRCGHTKPINRFYFNKKTGKYFELCKKHTIRDAAMGRVRKINRKSKKLDMIKEDINDKTYMDFGIDYLAEIITRNL